MLHRAHSQHTIDATGEGQRPAGTCVRYKGAAYAWRGSCGPAGSASEEVRNVDDMSVKHVQTSIKGGHACT